MADREFQEVHNATTELLQQETVAPIGDSLGETHDAAEQTTSKANNHTVNAFNFLRIAGHFFRDFEFEDNKVDDFVSDILKLDNSFQKSALHKCVTENLKIVREYRDHFMAENPDKAFSPYTSIRHCLHLHDPGTFDRMLSKRTRERFADWLKKPNI